MCLLRPAPAFWWRKSEERKEADWTGKTEIGSHCTLLPSRYTLSGSQTTYPPSPPWSSPKPSMICSCHSLLALAWADSISGRNAELLAICASISVVLKVAHHLLCCCSLSDSGSGDLLLDTQNWEAVFQMTLGHIYYISSCSRSYLSHTFLPTTL